MGVFWSSLLVVALAEMGDKTLAYHALASSVGDWVASHLSAAVLGWVLGLGSIAFGILDALPRLRGRA